MNGPLRVFCVWAPGIPIAAGTWRGAPFTKRVRCAWMWKRVCSLVWQLMPSTGWPLALVAAPASGAALGTGTLSEPAGPGEGAALSVPSELRLASFSPGGLALALPVVTARVMPTAAAAAAAPPAPSSERASLWPAAGFCCPWPRCHPLDKYLLPTYVDSSMENGEAVSGLCWQPGTQRSSVRGFGDLEDVIMHKVWNRDGPMTVREVLDELQQEQAIAYTTVMSTMDNL